MLNFRLKRRREERKLSQRALADIVGTTERQISRYEKGDHEPPASMIVKLANALNCSTDYLLGRTEEVGELNLDLLTPTEHNLIMMYRSNQLKELLGILAAAPKQGNK